MLADGERVGQFSDFRPPNVSAPTRVFSALGLALGPTRPATLPVRWSGYTAIGLSIAYSYGLMFLYITHRISRSEAPF